MLKSIDILLITATIIAVIVTFVSVVCTLDAFGIKTPLMGWMVETIYNWIS